MCLLDTGFGGCITVINGVEDGAVLCFLRLRRYQKKQEDCAESLHCVTPEQEKGEKGGRRGGKQGHGEGREGCVFTDLVRGMETPPPPTHHPASLLTCKGHFQTVPDRQEWKQQREEGQGRGADESQEKWDRLRLPDKYIHNDNPDQARSGKYLCENRKSLEGFETN